MRWKTGALTTGGFRIWDSIRHDDAATKKADGMMEKNSCSNFMLKSKSSRLGSSRLPSPDMNTIGIDC